MSFVQKNRVVFWAFPFLEIGTCQYLHLRRRPTVPVPSASPCSSPSSGTVPNWLLKWSMPMCSGTLPGWPSSPRLGPGIMCAASPRKTIAPEKSYWPWTEIQPLRSLRRLFLKLCFHMFFHIFFFAGWTNIGFPETDGKPGDSEFSINLFGSTMFKITGRDGSGVGSDGILLHQWSCQPAWLLCTNHLVDK